MEGYLSIDNEYFQQDTGLKVFFEKLDYQLLSSGGQYPYSKFQLEQISKSIESSDLVSILDDLIIEPVALMRFVGKYFSSNIESLHEALDLASSLDLNINSIIFGEKIVAYSDFFAGRNSALVSFYDLLVRAFLAGEFSSLQGYSKEQALILSYLGNLPVFLLALYNPGLHASLCLRTNEGHENFIFHFKQKVQKNLSDIVSNILLATKISEPYSELIQFINTPPWARKRWGSLNPEEAKAICQSYSMANTISAEIFQRSGTQGLQGAIRGLKRLSGVSQVNIENVLSKIPKFIKKVAELHNIPEIPLPEYVYWYDSDWESENLIERRKKFLDRFILQNKMSLVDLGNEVPNSLHESVWCTLEALLYGLGFQRAAYFSCETDKRNIKLEAVIGIKLFDYEKTEIELSQELEMLFRNSLKNGMNLNYEQAFFQDGWPLVVFPVIKQGELAGLFYADRAKRPDSQELDSSELDKVSKLAKVWELG